MCFNKTTQVTNTGLGDDQYNQIQANQTGLATQSQEGFGAVGTGINNLSSDIGTVNSGITGLTNTANTEFGNINTALTGLNTSMTANADAAGNSREQYYNNLLSQLNTNTGGLQSSLDTGFDNTGSRFDTLDSSVGNVQSGMDSGFAAQGERFDTVDTNVGNVQSAVDAGFLANTANVDAGFAATNTDLGNLGSQLNTTEGNVIAGQGTLQDTVDAMSGNADAYAATSLENQGTLQSTQDNFRSTFDDFSDRYTDDTTIANKSRADLALSQAGEAQRTREDLAGFVSGVDSGFADARATDASNQNETMGQLSGMAAESAVAQNNTIAELNNMAAGASADQNETMQQFQNIDAGQVVQLRNTAQVAAGLEGLDADMRNDFNQLGSAYDDNGDLIRSSIDQQGNTITRSINEQGMMMLNSFDVTGQKLGQSVIDVGARVNQLAQYSQATMGNLSPANSGATANTGSGLYTSTG